MANEPAAGVPTCYRHPGRETYIRCQRCDRHICPDCMRDAAVGFHCVSCLAEGAKSTRQNLTPFGGRRSADPRLTTFVLIGLNLLVWAAITATGGSRSRLFEVLALSPRGRCLIDDQPGFLIPDAAPASCVASSAHTWIDGVASGAVWQLLTHAFSHVQIWHIGLNMLVLFLIAPQLEAVFGRARFLAVYFGSVLAAAAAVMWLALPYGATIGASGGVFGLLGAMLVVTYKLGGDYQQILMWIGINVVITIWGSSFISWQGHLGGLIGGLLLAAAIVWAPKSRTPGLGFEPTGGSTRVRRRALLQWSGISTVVVVSALLIVARALTL
ncbi:rhomboid family intramembrane serine protease [Nocardioides limicola]|uniref:rhomboid family intramembrane serine protease n=1 Tax=Nocardioides limicola TaxID=2803368 RepID=UPI001EF0265A|nr:rhomboid family intramembrane serine protease [Nocardioides sp. DJM-14]